MILLAKYYKTFYINFFIRNFFFKKSKYKSERKKYLSFSQIYISNIDSLINY